MKSADKFLIGIVAGIALLVVIALVITLGKPEATYQPEDTPEGVALNYLLALQKEAYEKAYGYLSPELKGYPASVEVFVEDIQDHSWAFRLNYKTTISFISVKTIGNQATVTVKETRFRDGGLFESSQYVQNFDMELERVGGAWKIVDADYFFTNCWDKPAGCH